MKTLPSHMVLFNNVSETSVSNSRHEEFGMDNVLINWPDDNILHTTSESVNGNVLLVIYIFFGGGIGAGGG